MNSFIFYVFLSESFNFEIKNTKINTVGVAKLARVIYCMKSVRIGLNTERRGLSLCLQSKCGKIRSRKTPNTDTFHAVISAMRGNFYKVGHHTVFIVNYDDDCT